MNIIAHLRNRIDQHRCLLRRAIRFTTVWYRKCIGMSRLFKQRVPSPHRVQGSPRPPMQSRSRYSPLPDNSSTSSHSLLVLRPLNQSPAPSLQPLADHPHPPGHAPQQRSTHGGDGHRDQHFRDNPSHRPSLLLTVFRFPNPPSGGSTVGGQEQAHSVEHQDWIASSSSSTTYLSTFSIFAPSFRS